MAEPPTIACAYGEKRTLQDSFLRMRLETAAEKEKYEDDAQRLDSVRNTLQSVRDQDHIR